MRFGTAYAAFGGSAGVAPKIDHFCALVKDYDAQEMRKVVEAAGITMGTGPVGMPTDADGLRLQLPGGLAKTIIPAYRVNQEDAAVQPIGLDHVMLHVSDLEQSVSYYRKFFGMEASRTKNPARVWFGVAKTRLGLEPVAAGEAPSVHHICVRVARLIPDRLKAVGVEILPANDEKLPDGDGTLLDHSMILYGSSMSNGNQHDHDPLPLVLAGGASGSLNGGRHLKFAPHTPASNLLLAMLDKLGVHQDRHGDSSGKLEI